MSRSPKSSVGSIKAQAQLRKSPASSPALTMSDEDLARLEREESTLDFAKDFAVAEEV